MGGPDGVRGDRDAAGVRGRGGRAGRVLEGRGGQVVRDGYSGVGHVGRDADLLRFGRGREVHDAVVGPLAGDGGRHVDRHRETEPARVVGVVADDVDPARGDGTNGRHRTSLPAGPGRWTRSAVRLHQY